jgi:hypothetical protein
VLSSLFWRRRGVRLVLAKPYRRSGSLLSSATMHGILRSLNAVLVVVF